MSETECPTCGRDDFKSAQGMKNHHAKTHGESIAGELVECDYCGDEFRKPTAKIARNDMVFCSKKCQHDWFGEMAVDEQHPGWSGGKITIECEYCGSPTEKHPWQMEGKGHLFCSRKCCWSWRSENLVGENHPDWEGGQFPYGAGWNPAKREEVRKSQNRRCAGCRTHERDCRTRLPVHHIQPARSFDDAEARNAESNLVALCQTCHNEWEQMAPLRPDVSGVEA